MSHKLFKFGPISNSPLSFGEGPIWDHRRGKLVLIDAFGKSVVIFDPKTGEYESKVVSLPDDDFQYVIVALPCFSSQNKFGVAVSSAKLLEFDWTSGKVVNTLYDCQNPRRSFSDGKCDPKGRLWIGTESFDKAEGLGDLKIDEDKGELLRIWKNSGSFSSSMQATKFDIPNGLSFNKEHTKVYWNDLIRRTISVFDFDLENGNLSNRKLFFNFADHKESLGELMMPDGLTLDVAGNVWVACWKGSCVIKVDGVTGKLLEKIELPVSLTTSLCFGGQALEKLYVTSARVDLDLSEVKGEKDAGKIFEVTNPKDNSFKGFPFHFLDL